MSIHIRFDLNRYLLNRLVLKQTAKSKKAVSCMRDSTVMQPDNILR